MHEQWKDIPGYEGIYQASNMGNIRSTNGKTTSNARYSVRKWKSRILKPKKRRRKNGTYDYRVDLWKNGSHKSMLVSRLVAMAWCYGYGSELTVNHIDGNTLNNTPENLEWVPRSENIRKGFETGLYKNVQKQCALTDLQTSTVYTFMSQCDASKFLGYSHGYVNRKLKEQQTNVISKDGTKYAIQLF